MMQERRRAVQVNGAGVIVWGLIGAALWALAAVLLR